MENQVHFLQAISYDEYRGMNTVEIAEMVKNRIVNRITEVLNPA